MIFKEIIGYRLSKLREKQNLDIACVSKRTKLSLNNLEKWEKNLDVPNEKQLNKLADFYNVTTDYLYGEDRKTYQMRLNLTDPNETFVPNSVLSNKDKDLCCKLFNEINELKNKYSQNKNDDLFIEIANKEIEIEDLKLKHSKTRKMLFDIPYHEYDKNEILNIPRTELITMYPEQELLINNILDKSKEFVEKIIDYIDTLQKK